MELRSTSGSTGEGQVGNATMDTIMSTWSIPDQFAWFNQQPLSKMIRKRTIV